MNFLTLGGSLGRACLVARFDRCPRISGTWSRRSWARLCSGAAAAAVLGCGLAANTTASSSTWRSS
eukprot:11178825-Lingulodinium_polyedra.AAC.1